METVMIGTPYSTAENPIGSLAQRIHFQRLEGAGGPIGTIVGIALVAALLIAVHFWRVRKDGGISGPL